MDASLSESESCGLNFSLKAPADLQPRGKSLAIPEEPLSVGLEVLKFLATLALIAVYGLILLMLG
ncbi:MAG: hypothetical protein ACUVXF_12550 [Desulfobaccales bacterium]